MKCPASSAFPDLDNSIEVLGVDDWAWRKGQSYGTILVDLEQRRVSDLLPDRSTESFAAWLHQQPRVRVISRDRGGIYAEGAQLGAPGARQVADRFHLFLNLSTAIERALQERHHQLLLATPAPPQTETFGSGEVRRTRQQALQQERRQRRLEHYEKMIQLHRQGCSQKKISEVLHLDRRAIRRWIRAGVFPEHQAPRRGPTNLHRFEAYLQQRWAEGCHNATRLFEELRRQGYPGSCGTVAQHVAKWRNSPQAVPTTRRQQITSKQVAIWLSRLSGQLAVEQQLALDQLAAQCPDVVKLREFSIQFREALQSGQGQALRAWIMRAEDSGIGSLARFAAGLRKDLSAVLAAVETYWSNGQVEGQINRLNTLKRQMYGRAGFALLRARVLPYIPLSTLPHAAAAA